MFTVQVTQLDADPRGEPSRSVLGYAVQRSGRPLTRGEAYRALVESEDFRAVLSGACAGAPMGACFFELPAVAPAGDGLPFEWVLVASPGLEGVRAEPDAFAEHWSPTDPVACFDNLGGDARLVAPRPPAQAPGPEGLEAFGHLAAFLRGGPPGQVDALWRAVGAELAARRSASPRPFWVSTSGLGVPWLHVRIDERPKYVTHLPYRVATSGTS